jgi:hypothetical protein
MINDQKVKADFFLFFFKKNKKNAVLCGQLRFINPG